MKKIIFSILIIISVSNTYAYNNISIEYFSELNKVNVTNIDNIKLIEQYESCSIYLLKTKDGKVFWNVIAAIGTVFLPEISQEICMKTIGDPDICQAVYDVTSVLVTISGNGIRKGITKGLYWLANKKAKKSIASIGTKTYDIASTIKDVFEYYREINCINWENVNYNSKEQIDYAGATTYKNKHRVTCNYNKNTPSGVTKSFIQDLGDRYFYTAYNKTKNRVWASYTHFKSESAFGGINKTKIIDINQKYQNSSSAKIRAEYKVWDPLHSNNHYIIDYYLQKYSGNWKITQISVVSLYTF